MGGADFVEAVKRGWWLERRGGRNVEEMETVVSLAEYEDGDAPADEDGVVANRDVPIAVPGGLPAPPPPNASGNNDDDRLPPLLSSDSDDEDDATRQDKGKLRRVSHPL